MSKPPFAVVSKESDPDSPRPRVVEPFVGTLTPVTLAEHAVRLATAELAAAPNDPAAPERALSVLAAAHRLGARLPAKEVPDGSPQG